MGTCGLWLLELMARGWRHPLLAVLPAATATQVVVDLYSAGVSLQASAAGHGGSDGTSNEVAAGGSDEDSIGHLAGAVAGVAAYAFLRRRVVGVVPTHPLLPAASAPHTAAPATAAV